MGREIEIYQNLIKWKYISVGAILIGILLFVFLIMSVTTNNVNKEIEEKDTQSFLQGEYDRFIITGEQKIGFNSKIYTAYDGQNGVEYAICISPNGIMNMIMLKDLEGNPILSQGIGE